MKLALVSGAPNSAVDQVLQDLHRGLTAVRPEWEVDLVRFESRSIDELRLGDYDLVHLGYVGYPLGAAYEFTTPVTANVWHIVPERLEAHRKYLAPIGYTRLVVDDVMTLQLLGQIGFTNVTPIPMAFDASRFQRLNAPSGAFTVGCFGDDLPKKRFSIIPAAAAAAGCRAYMMVTPLDRKVFVLDPVEDVYAQIHAFVHASFTDTNCRPALEALACGLPVLSTMNDGLRRVANGGNILFYDGSIHDLADKIRTVQENYEWHRESAAYTSFPSMDLVALKYATMFERVLEDAQ